MYNPYQPPDELYPDDDLNVPDEHEGPDYDEAREYWPACPDCGKRLTITCPFCKTTDDLFPLGDTEYWDDDLGGSLVEYQHRLDRQLASRSVLFGDGDRSMPFDEHGCSCRKVGQMPNELYGGASPQPTGGHGNDSNDENTDDDDELFDGDFDDEDFDDEPERDYDRESLPFVVVCPTCSEAFIPSFPGGCRHCHYVWDRSKPIEAEQAVDAHRRHTPPVNNPALRELAGLSVTQLAIIFIGIVVTLIVMIFLFQRIAGGATCSSATMHHPALHSFHRCEAEQGEAELQGAGNEVAKLQTTGADRFVFRPQNGTLLEKRSVTVRQIVQIRRDHIRTVIPQRKLDRLLEFQQVKCQGTFDGLFELQRFGAFS